MKTSKVLTFLTVLSMIVVKCFLLECKLRREGTGSSSCELSLASQLHFAVQLCGLDVCCPRRPSKLQNAQPKKKTISNFFGTAYGFLQGLRMK